MTRVREQHGMGWLADYPDFRDYVPNTPSVAGKLKKTKLTMKPLASSEMPAKHDLTEGFPPIEDQGHLGSCTANAGVGLFEYFERRAFGSHIDASRLFLYKTTRNLLHLQGDTGAYLRSTMGAMALFGVPPEEYWPYNVSTYDVEPPACCYAFAQQYKALEYFRLDPPGSSPKDNIGRIKSYLLGGFPSMFGFTVYTSISQAEDDGAIPLPMEGEKVEGGHAVVAVGYDDAITIKNDNPKGHKTKGALKIRNSWGPEWGEGGYGWLPY